MSCIETCRPRGIITSGTLELIDSLTRIVVVLKAEVDETGCNYAVDITIDEEAFVGRRAHAGLQQPSEHKFEMQRWQRRQSKRDRASTISTTSVDTIQTIDQ